MLNDSRAWIQARVIRRIVRSPEQIVVDRSVPAGKVDLGGLLDCGVLRLADAESREAWIDALALDREPER